MTSGWRGWDLTPVEYALFGKPSNLRNCLVCGAEYMPTRKASKYCSRKCGNVMHQRNYYKRKHSVC